jgi:hypothetical protein
MIRWPSLRMLQLPRADNSGQMPVRKQFIRFEGLKHILSGQYQFAPEGLLRMVVGGLGVYMRAIPERLWGWFVGQTTMMITVKDDDATFVWANESFLEQKFLTRIGRFDSDTTLRCEQLALIPARGDHWF